MNKEYITYLVELNNIKALEKLLKFESESTFDVNECNAEGQSLLHLAVALNRTEITALLVENGAKLNVQDKRKQTPLCFATNNANLKLCNYLLEKQACPHMGEPTPLEIAIENKSFDIATALFFACKPNENCLYFALPYPDWTRLIVKVLSATVMLMKNAQGQHAGHVCALLGHENSIFYLLEQTASQLSSFVNCQDANKNTMLHLAVQNKKYAMVEALLEVPCIKATLVNNEGHNALHIAMMNRDAKMVKILEKRMTFHSNTLTFEYQWNTDALLQRLDKNWTNFKKIAATQVAEEQLARFCAREDFYQMIATFSASDLVQVTNSIKIHSGKIPCSFENDTTHSMLKSQVATGIELAQSVGHWELKYETEDIAVYKSKHFPKLVRITGIVKNVIMDQVMHALCEERIKGCKQIVKSMLPSSEDRYSTAISSEEVSNAFSFGGHLNTMASCMIDKHNAQIFMYKSIEGKNKDTGLFHVAALGNETVRFVIVKNDEYEQPSLIIKLLTHKNRFARFEQFFKTVQDLANKSTFLCVQSTLSRRRRKTDSAVNLLKVQ